MSKQTDVDGEQRQDILRLLYGPRFGEDEARARLKITRLLGDLLPAERERVLADINARYAKQDDHK